MINFHCDRIIKVTLLVMCLIHQGHTDIRSNTGKEFIIGILKPYDTHNTKIDLQATSETSGTVTFDAPDYWHSVAHRNLFNGSVSLGVPQQMIHEAYGAVRNKGIRVTSDVDISLSIITYPHHMHEGALALPVTSLSTEYIVSSYHVLHSQGNTWQSEFLVVGVTDGTTVHFQRRQNNVKENGTFTVHLNRMQTYLYKAMFDLSGSIIRSDKPVAVFSGNEAAEVPNGAYGGEHLVEQLPPTDTFGKMFIVPNIYPKTRYIVRAYARDANTDITYENSSLTITKHGMESGEYIEVLSSTDPLSIRGNKPLMVMLYSTGLTFTPEHHGDPFMTTVPAISQFKDDYYFTVSSHYSHFDHYLVVTSPSSQGLLLDGTGLSNTISTRNTAVGGVNYTVITVRMQQGVHHIVHTMGIKFGAILYGLYGYTSDEHYAYAYPLGMQFPLEDHSQNSTTPATGHMCFSCNDMTHLELCDTITRCNKNEQCFVESSVTTGGQIKYNSGCLETTKCQSSKTRNQRSTTSCVECCTGDYCNTYGCGGTGLPPRDRRGPLCFDCGIVSTMDECRTVRLCQPNEVCSIEVYVWGGMLSHYTANCHSNQCTSLKRATADCQQCCHDDFCNNQCTTATSQPPGGIVG